MYLKHVNLFHRAEIGDLTDMFSLTPGRGKKTRGAWEQDWQNITKGWTIIFGGEEGGG